MALSLTAVRQLRGWPREKAEPKLSNQLDYAPDRAPWLRRHRSKCLIGVAATLAVSVGWVVAVIISDRVSQAAIRERARRNAASTDLALLAEALERFRGDVGRFPTSKEGLQVLVMSPWGLQGWRGPYLKAVPVDPWGTPYTYREWAANDTNGYHLCSAGPNRTAGTPDDVTRERKPK